MAVRTRDVLFGLLGEVRVHPVAQRVRAVVGTTTVVDSRDVLLVWEPRRVVGSYAVPVADVAGTLRPTPPVEVDEHPLFLGEGLRVLDPSHPFTLHTTPGRTLTVETVVGDLEGAAFAADDPDLDGYVVLDWGAFTLWYEEDERVMGHPHDPFDRIDCLRSARHVVLELEGTVLADSRRSVMLLETPLPVRYYLPREDVRLDLLRRSDLRTVCAYKGEAAYWDAQVGDHVLEAVAWTYEAPLHDAVPVAGLVAFLTERLDLTLDGQRLERPLTPWS